MTLHSLQFLILVVMPWADRHLHVFNHGNLCIEDYPQIYLYLEIALANKSCDGIVITQVNRTFDPSKHRAHLDKLPAVF